MKTSRTLAKILSMILVLSMLVLTVASCDLFKGSLELKSFTVDRSTIKTAYYLGDEINFTDIRAYAKYSDSSLDKEYTYSELTITYAPDITATEGQKEVKVSFQDPNLNTEVSATVLITVTEDPNAIKHASYAVDSTGMKTTYLIGDTLNFTGVKVIEKFTNGGADVEMTDLSTISYEYAQDITATPGIKTVIVKYNGESAGSISITVNRPGINEAALDTTGVTLEYLVGDTVSFTGLKAYITYENGQTATITDFTFKTDLTTLTGTVGEKTVIVEFRDELSGTTREASFKVKVDGVVDYTIDTSDMTLSYLENETVSFEGIKVTAHYNFGKTESVAFSALTFVHADNLTASVGNKTVTVKVGDSLAGSFIVAVGDIPTATANTAGVTLSYLVGQTVSLEGLTVTLKFTDGTADQTVALADLEVETALAGLTATAGTKTIAVKYQFDEYYLYASFDITVYGITHYEVEGAIKGEYVAGKTYTIDYSDIKVYAVYGNGERVLVDASRVTFSDTNATLTAGEKQIPVLVDGKDTQETVTLTVSRNVVKSVEVGGNFDNKYKLNETTDFTGLTVTITYADGTVVTVTSNITFSNIETNAVTNPYKNAKVTLTDEINGETIEATFIMVVTDNRQVSAFEQDANISAFESDNNPETRYDFGQNGFESQFAVGGQTYVIGDDNEFRYQPTFAFDKDGDDEYLTQYFADVTLYVDGAPLERRAVTNSITNYEYYLGSTKIATVDTYNGKYQFHTSLANVTISVMPSSDYYEVPADIKAVTLNAKVVDAYNVYEAWQLSLIDNRDDYGDADDDDYFAWQDFRTEKGLGNLRVNGVVIHDDINITVDDIPERFITRTTEEFTYKNTVSGETVTVPVGTRFLKPVTYVYSRCGGNFTIHGNFFHLSLYNTDSTDPLAYMKNFPLEPSPEAKNEAGVDYGLDFSNSVLFHGASVDYNGDAHFYISNLSLRGNAGRDNWVAEKNGATHLASAGGLLMVKSSDLGMTVHVDNVISNSFYIAYLADWGGTMNVSNVKAYNSYQNAIYVSRNSTVVASDSWFSGVGGPAIISQGNESRNDVIGYANITLTNTVLDTSLSGNELWFKMLGALSPDIEGMVQQIQGMGTLLGPLGTWLKDGKMNIKCVQLYGMDFADVTAQGYMNINGAVMDKYYSANSHYWNTILPTMQAGAGAAPFLTVIDAQGKAHTAYYNGSELVSLTGNDYAAAFMQAKDIILTKGGLSIVLEFYH